MNQKISGFLELNILNKKKYQDSEKPRQPAVARARTETTSSTASSASSTDTKGPRKSSPTKQAGTSSPSSSPKTKPRASAVKPVQVCNSYILYLGLKICHQLRSQRSPHHRRQQRALSR